MLNHLHHPLYHQPPIIDLTLAVNYIPACSCIIRLLVYLLCLTILSHYGDDRTYVLLSLLLYIDRRASQAPQILISSTSHILDSSSILLTVFFANVYQHLRRTTDDVHFTVLLVYFFWSLFAGALILDRGTLTHFLENRLPFPGYIVESQVTCLVIGYLLYHPAQNEPYGCLLTQAISFAVLVIVWVYLVGLKNPTHMTSRYIARFLPVLILPIWMSILFSLACLILLFIHFKRQWWPTSKDVQGGSSLSGTETFSTTSNTTIEASNLTLSTIPEEPYNTNSNSNSSTIQDPSDKEDIEAMFRKAKLHSAQKIY